MQSVSSPASAKPRTAERAASGLDNLGNLVLLVATAAALADVLTTWYLLRFVPGGYEANRLMAGLMRAIGLGPALAVRGAIGVAYAWFARGIISGRYQPVRLLFDARPYMRFAVLSGLLLVTGALCIVVLHNAVLLTSGS
jgi:hypothetical protein